MLTGLLSWDFYILSPAVAVTEPRTLVARRVTEVAQSTLIWSPPQWTTPYVSVTYTLIVSELTLEIILFMQSESVVFKHLVLSSGFVKGVARPDYWIPDHEIIQCHSCTKPFTPSMSKHHCRACGQGVCGNCSMKTRPVPSHGWDHPVRVCDSCAESRDSLWPCCASVVPLQYSLMLRCRL